MDGEGHEGTCKICGQPHPTRACQDPEYLKRSTAHPKLYFSETGPANMSERPRDWETDAAWNMLGQELQRNGMHPLLEESGLTNQVLDEEELRMGGSRALGDYRNGNWEGAQRFLERIISSSENWDENNASVRSMLLAENEEKIRAYQSAALRKTYEQGEKQLPPTTFKEIEGYIKELVAGFRSHKNEGSNRAARYLQDIINKKDYSALMYRVDASITIEQAALASLESGQLLKDFPEDVELLKKRFSTDNPVPQLKKEIDKLRVYREFLWEQTKKQKK